MLPMISRPKSGLQSPAESDALKEIGLTFGRGSLRSPENGSPTTAGLR